MPTCYPPITFKLKPPQHHKTITFWPRDGIKTSREVGKQLEYFHPRRPKDSLRYHEEGYHQQHHSLLRVRYCRRCYIILRGRIFKNASACPAGISVIYSGSRAIQDRFGSWLMMLVISSSSSGSTVRTVHPAGYTHPLRARLLPRCCARHPGDSCQLDRGYDIDKMDDISFFFFFFTSQVYIKPQV